MLNARTLHVQNRSVPTAKNYRRCITIGIVYISARCTNKARLALSASLINGSTGGTGLRTESRVDLDKSHHLVAKHGFDLEPPDIEDRAVKPALGRDIPARLIKRAGRALGNILSAKTLNNDSTILPSDGCYDAMRPILPDAGLPRLQAGSAPDSASVATRTPLAPASKALRSFVPLVDCGKRSWHSDHLATAKREWCGYATVNADRATRIRNVTIDQAADADLPSKRGANDRCFPDTAFHRPSATEFEPTKLWQPNARPLGIQFFNRDLSPRKAEGIVDALFLWLRKASAASKEVAECRVEVLKNPLLSGLANSADKVELRTKLFKMPCLGNIVQVVPGTGLVLPPPVAPLLKRQVPNKPTHAGELNKSLFLLWRKVQPVGKSSENHIKLMARFPTNRNMRLLPGMCAQRCPLPVGGAEGASGTRSDMRSINVGVCRFASP
jgi:hypothetical protein